MPGKCPKCEKVVTIACEPVRARDEISGRTCPAIQFMCSNCLTILSVSLDPDWHSQVMGQLKRSESESHR